MKEQEWAAIAGKVSAIGPVTRTAAQTRKKWSDFSSRTKNKHSSYKKELRLTGGGRNKVTEVTDIEAKALAVLSPVAIDGIKGAIDSDKASKNNLTQDSSEGRNSSFLEEAFEEDSRPNASNDSSSQEEELIFDTPSTSYSKPSSKAPSTVSRAKRTSTDPSVSFATVPPKRIAKQGQETESGSTANSYSAQLLAIEQQKLKIKKKQLHYAKKQYKAINKIAMVLSSNQRS